MRRSLLILLVLAGCTRNAPVAAPAPAAAIAPPVVAPAAPSLRDGVDPGKITPAGLERASLDVDAFNSRAHLAFKAESGVTVYLALSVQESVAAAQAAVSLEASRITGTSVPAASVGIVADTGFAAADAAGNCAWAALSRANITAVLRSQDDASLRAVAKAWLAAVDASDQVAALRRPSFTLATSQEARAGSPNPVAISVDPTGPAPVSFAYLASDGASLVGSKLGPVLYAAKAGTVHIRVAGATSRLVSSVVESDVTLGK